MVGRLLFAAAVVAAAAAVGEYKVVLGGGCGCGINGAGIQTYNLTTAAYCPSSAYPSCNITNMVEQECTISCSEPRAVLVYRNNSAVWMATSSISCVKNADGVTTQLINSEGQALYNFMRPGCAYKHPCNACNVTYQPTCPAGMTCKADNLERTTASDDCGRLGCKTGTLKLYNTSGAPMEYYAKELFCTVVGKWTNYSRDGSIVGGNIIQDPFTANCVLPKACEDCVVPKTAVTLISLPSTFHTGYNIAPGSLFKEAGSCSEFTCPTGFTLYGFTGNSTTATGLEYTNKGKLRCESYRWTNGGYEWTPLVNSFLVACLQMIPPCKTCAPNLISVTATGINAKPMDADVTSMNETCAQRTFTCNGPGATINVFGAGGKALGGVLGSKSATFTVTCNTAGTGWEAAGYTITRVECYDFPPSDCDKCYNAVVNTYTGLDAVWTQLIKPVAATFPNPVCVYKCPSNHLVIADGVVHANVGCQLDTEIVTAGGQILSSTNQFSCNKCMCFASELTSGVAKGLCPFGSLCVTPILMDYCEARCPADSSPIYFTAAGVQMTSTTIKCVGGDWIAAGKDDTAGVTCLFDADKGYTTHPPTINTPHCAQLDILMPCPATSCDPTQLIYIYDGANYGATGAMCKKGSLVNDQPDFGEIGIVYCHYPGPSWQQGITKANCVTDDSAVKSCVAWLTHASVMNNIDSACAYGYCRINCKGANQQFEYVAGSPPKVERNRYLMCVVGEPYPFTGGFLEDAAMVKCV